ncbi:MAG: RidA family protein [Hyphomicrobiales bacterium]
MSKIDDRLNELGLSLPKPVAPVANYLGYALTGQLVFISGQLPLGPSGVKYQGKLGVTISVEDGIKAARLCGLNIIAQLKTACGGNLDRVTRCLKLGGFVNAAPDFTEYPKIINGCSDLMVEVFGNAGRHARFALGAGGLPLNVAVEIEAIFEIA